MDARHHVRVLVIWQGQVRPVDQHDPKDDVRGYARVRPFGPDDPRAVVVYMKGRGLQLQHRSELRGWRTDDTVMQRLLSIQAQQSALEHAMIATLRDG